MNKDYLKLEHAKSWFVLAQLSMILSGFLFASSSIAFTQSQESFNAADAMISENINLYLSSLNYASILVEANLTNEYSEIMNNLNKLAQNKLSLGASYSNFGNTAFYFAMIFAYLSIIIFIWGKLKIFNIRED